MNILEKNYFKFDFIKEKINHANDIIDYKCIKYNLEIWEISFDIEEIVLDKDYLIHDWNEYFKRINLDIESILSTFLLRNKFNEWENKETASNNIFNYNFLNKLSIYSWNNYEYFYLSYFLFI